MPGPALYLDPQSPYGWLAFERAPALLGVTPELRPISLGPIFQWRGSGSWGRTDAREAGMREVERRARAYGLPDLRWPEGWPVYSQRPARALTWAHGQGAGPEFLHALGAAIFTRGEDPSDLDVLRATTATAGLDPAALEAEVDSEATKATLSAATTAAWEAGVRGVPTTAVGDQLYFGDDRLEEAGGALGA